MENFFFNDIFFSDIYELVEYECWEISDIESEPEDYVLNVELSCLEPIITLNSTKITERIDDERFSKNGIDREIDKINKILNEHIDFDKINNKIPKLYYKTGQIHSFTKSDLLEAINQLYKNSN